MTLACPALIADVAPGMCKAVDIYCERTTDALWAEPLNAISNVAFLIAALAIWRLRAAHPNASSDTWVRALSAIIFVVGLGSFAFHTIATRWAEWADVIPILVFMLAYCWLFLTLYFGWHWAAKSATVALFFGATFMLEAENFDWLLWGGAMYVPSIALLLGLGGFVRRSHPAAGRAFFIATAVFLVSFAARTLDMPVCPSLPIGTHYFWHICNATVLYLLVRIIVLHPPEEAESRASA